jgi:hypothetical protein
MYTADTIIIALSNDTLGKPIQYNDKRGLERWSQASE